MDNFCSNCGTKLAGDEIFCHKCGVKIQESSLNNQNIKEQPINIDKNSNQEIIKNKKSTLLFLGAVIVFVIILIVVGAYLSPSSETQTENVTLSPAFNDTIDGITFCIPEGYKTDGGQDNVNKYTYSYSQRNYIYNASGVITPLTISVYTSGTGFVWNLNQNRDINDDVDLTINGHQGVYTKSSSTFKYLVDGKMIVIVGADQNLLEKIII